MKRHYVKAHKRQGKPVSSYIRGKDTSPFKLKKRKSVHEQLETLNRESEQIENERYEQELAKLRSDFEERNKKINQYYGDEMSIIREEVAHKVPAEEQKIILDKKAGELFGTYFKEVDALDRKQKDTELFLSLIKELEKVFKENDEKEDEEDESK